MQKCSSAGGHIFVAALHSVTLPDGARLRMENLRAMAEELGLEAVATVASTGNLLFRAHIGSSARLETELEAAFNQRFARHVPIIVRPAQDFARIPDRMPFDRALDPKLVSVRVMRDAYEDGFVESIRRFVDDEEIAVVGGDVWIAHKSDPARSRLPGAIGRQKPQRVGTFRTLAMINKIIAAADGIPAEGRPCAPSSHS